MSEDQRLWLDSPDPACTRDLAASLARLWLHANPARLEANPAGSAAGLVVSLQGDLGAGKTVFVKGLARGLGVPEESVSSPTFVLANEYGSTARGHSLHHVDFYRLESAAELETMGFFEMIGEGNLLAVEWGGKFAQELPEDRIEVQIRANGGDETGGRRISVEGTGPMTKGLLEAWRISLKDDDLADGNLGRGN